MSAPACLVAAALALGAVACAAGCAAPRAPSGPPPGVYVPARPPGADALPGAGKHVVLVAGDEEYRSEEALPMLARVLAVRHGFRCTVLFSQDPQTGVIDPGARGHIPGLAVLDDADLLVLFTRFRNLPDADMAHLADYVESGRPVIGLRTATHAFDLDAGSPHAAWSWNSETWPGGFGRQVLGETWVAHYGRHGEESTRGVVPAAAAGHPVVRGVGAPWGPTDVYAVRALPADATVVLEGEVLTGMSPDDAPVQDGRNAPRMPVAWVRERALPSGAGDGVGEPRAKVQRVVCCTMGAAEDFRDEHLRRLFVNACYWALAMEDRLPAQADVEPVGTYRPGPFGFGKHRRGVRPADLAREPAGR